MARLLASLSSAVLVAAAAIVASAQPAAARDYGQRGTLFPVTEPDLLAVIEARLRQAEATGKLASLQTELRRRTERHVRRPPPVPGITATRKARVWTYDPSITTDQDIRDHQGRVVVARGVRVNPLDTVALRQSLVFLDGDDPAQVRWALGATTQLNAKLILVNGSAFELMGHHQRRFYHDQRGALTSKLGIRHVPAVVEQDGRVLKITELVTPRASRPLALTSGAR